MLGTDIKAFMNHEDFKIDKRNKPRIFANAFKMSNKKVLFRKVYSLFVITERMISVLLVYSSSEMLHDSKKRQFITIMR